MISICHHCSGVDYDKLKLVVGEENISTTCIGECGGRDGLSIGYISGDFIEAETEEEFLELAKKSVE